MKRVFLLTVFPFSTEVTRASTLSGLSKVTPLVGGSDGLCDSLAGQGAPLQVGPGRAQSPRAEAELPTGPRSSAGIVLLPPPVDAIRSTPWFCSLHMSMGRAWSICSPCGLSRRAISSQHQPSNCLHYIKSAVLSTLSLTESAIWEIVWHHPFIFEFF